MPINWNKADKARLEYIQQKEIAEARYKEEYKLFCAKKKNQGFLGQLFCKIDQPELPYLFEFESCIYEINNKVFICIDEYNINIIDLYKILSKKDLDQIRTYLDIDKIIKNIDQYNYCIETYCIKDTEENRKKIDKLIQFIEKRLEQNFLTAKKESERRQKEAEIKQKEADIKQKEAEAFIDNYINDKEGK